MEQQAEEENKAPVRGRRWRKRKRSRMPLEKPDPASETTSPQPDPLSLLHPTSESDSDGEDCELQIYDQRFDGRSEKVTLRAGTRSHNRLEKDKNHRAGFVLTRHFGHMKGLLFTEFEIRSPYAKRAFRDVIKSYPGVNINYTAAIIMRNEPKCIFHYRHQLEAYIEACEEPRSAEHVKFCLEYMKKALQSEMKTYNATVSMQTSNPGLEYEHLWMAYIPGTLLYHQDQEFHMVSRLKTMAMVHKKDEDQPEWAITAEVLGCDGYNIGYCGFYATIARYDGVRAFNHLVTFPFQYHPDHEEIKKSLILRGKVFISMVGVHHRHYRGKFMSCPGLINPDASMKMLQPLTINDRIMIDCRGFRENCRNAGVRFLEGTKVCNTNKQEHMDIGDDELLLCYHSWPGFSLGNKRWGYFDVTKVKEVEFNDTAFDNLQLAESNKRLMYSLAKIQNGEAPNFDDMIKGKGKGLIFLLHGPPGVGKTYTAESIADLTRRPLFTMTSGHLAGPPPLVEIRIVEQITLATRWNALVLLDEADVFMQERNLQDLDRNSLVSILLRHLEYFEGIMFLTTNPVETIDSAFKSRIHLSIAYPPLSEDSKRILWEQGLTRANSEERPSWLTRTELDRLAQANISGREIKNITKMAHALACNENRSIDKIDVSQGLEALELFNADFIKDVAGRRDTGDMSSDRASVTIESLRKTQAIWDGITHFFSVAVHMFSFGQLVQNVITILIVLAVLEILQR